MELVKILNCKFLIYKIIHSDFDSSKQNKIRIGRIKTNNVEVALADESISRVQCT